MTKEKSCRVWLIHIDPYWSILIDIDPYWSQVTVSACEKVSKAVCKWLRRLFQSIPSGVSQLRPPSTCRDEKATVSFISPHPHPSNLKTPLLSLYNLYMIHIYIYTLHSLHIHIMVSCQSTNGSILSGCSNGPPWASIWAANTNPNSREPPVKQGLWPRSLPKCSCHSHCIQQFLGRTWAYKYDINMI